MCQWCEQYGDSAVGGGLWYLNPKNYARGMYRLRPPGGVFKGAEAGLETGERTGPSTSDLLEAMESGQREEYDRIFQELRELSLVESTPSQIVPLEDADRVLKLCSPMGIMACICRKQWRAVDERNELEYTCMGMGAGMLKWERWPERYKGGVKFVNTEEAIEWNHEMDKRGFVHLLMTFGVPFVGGFCQCDYPDCIALRSAVDFGLGTLKSHYIAEVDYDLCNGCGICAQRCQFGALKFEVTSSKANIDQFKCFGCGLCQTGCPRDAIRLVERKSLPTLANEWRGVGTYTVRTFPKISIDQEKCTVPFLCKKCLQICPTAVFNVERVMAKEERLKEMDPRIDGNYVLSVPRRDKCLACNKCIEVCPVDAIRIEVT